MLEPSATISPSEEQRRGRRDRGGGGVGSDLRAAISSFDHTQFDAETLLAAKAGRSVSVCLPALDEAATIGTIVSVLHHQLIEKVGLVDEIVVADDGSADATAERAAAAGARVITAEEVLPHHDRGPGKGQALWRALYATSGDLVVFLDADVVDFGAHYVVGLLGPLLVDEDVCLVKGYYERPMRDGPGEGGRVTELVARPLLGRLFPHLAGVRQPLAGETAAPRRVLEAVPFVDGYGVEMGLLIDVARRFGTCGLAQVDLGQRVHRNRPLHELANQAGAVIDVALSRSNLRPPAGDSTPDRPPSGAHGERPPLCGLVGPERGRSAPRLASG